MFRTFFNKLSFFNKKVLWIKSCPPQPFHCKLYVFHCFDALRQQQTCDVAKDRQEAASKWSNAWPPGLLVINGPFIDDLDTIGEHLGPCVGHLHMVCQHSQPWYVGVTGVEMLRPCFACLCDHVTFNHGASDIILETQQSGSSSAS